MTRRTRLQQVPVRAHRDGSPLGAIGIIIVAIAMATTGPRGTGLAIGLVFLWIVSPPIVVFFLGQLLVLALWAPGPLVGIWPVQIGLFLVLAGPLTTPRLAPGRTVVAFALSTLGLLVVTGIALRTTGSIIDSGLLLIATTALVAYALHRYELLALDLIES